MTPIEITILLSDEYYEAIFADWLQYRSKNRKWQKLTGIILVAVGIICAVVVWRSKEDWSIISVACVLMGVFQIRDFYRAKRQWLHDRKSSQVMGEKVHMTFTPEVFHHSGPFANGEYKWSGVQQIQETGNGLFLVLGTGISMYLPKAAFRSLQEFETTKSYAQQHLPASMDI